MTDGALHLDAGHWRRLSFLLERAPFRTITLYATEGRFMLWMNGESGDVEAQPSLGAAVDAAMATLRERAAPSDPAREEPHGAR